MSDTKAAGWTFAQVPIWLLCNDKITDGAKVLLSYLKYRQGTDAACWPSKQTMAFDLGVSIETIGRRLTELVKWGYVKKHLRTGYTTLYEIRAEPEGEKRRWLTREKKRKQARNPPPQMTPPPTDDTTLPPTDDTHDESQERESGTTHAVRTASVQPTVDTADGIAVEQPIAVKAPPAPPVPTVDEMRAASEAELVEVMGPRTQAKAEPITSNGDWQARVRDNPHLRWGSESQELQRQVKRYGSASQPVLKLGYELEQAFGLRPPWSNRQKVKQWTAGLVSCLEETEGDWLLVIDTARKMRNDGLTIKTPHSIVGMVGSAMAKRRSKQPTEYDRIRQRMENDPQYQAGKIMYAIEQAEREAARVERESNDEQA